MRVMVLNWLDRQNPAAGGAELHLHETFGRIADRGHDVTLVTSGWRGATPLADLDGIQVHRTGGRHSFLFAGPRRARRLLADERFDVVVEDLNKVPLFAPLWTRVPVVGLVHHLFGSTALKQGGMLLGTATWLLELPLARVFKGRPMVAVSRSTADDLERRGVQAKDVSVIHNGVNARFFQESSVDPDPDPTVLFLGRLKRYKRADLIIEAVARLKGRGVDVALIVAGEGDERSNLERRARELAVTDRVTFEGSVTEEHKRDLFHRAWVHVVTSEKEGWGLTVIEAGACGTPSVASDSPGLSESIRDGVSGILVPHGKVAALATAMERLLTNAPLRAAMGKAARDWAETLSWDRTADRTLEVLRQARERSRADG